MTPDEALQVTAAHAKNWPDPRIRTRLEDAAILLAAEVLRLREQCAHLERLALRSRSTSERARA